MSDTYLERVNAAKDFIRGNLTNDLTVASVANSAHFSPYHFHRIFSAVAGETITEYTRRARLERAIYLMKSSPAKSLTRVATDAGFRSSSDFSRVFKAVYGISPSQWDRIAPLTPTEVVGGNGGGPGRFGRPETPFEAVEAALPSERIAYVRVTGPFDGASLPDAYDLLRERFETVGRSWNDMQLIGMSRDSYDATPIDQVQFDIGYVVPDGTTIPDGLATIELPEKRWVSAHSDGPMLGIAQAWDFLYLEWLPRSRYEPADLPAVKRFRRQPAETGWEHWDVDCCIAISPLRL